MGAYGLRKSTFQNEVAVLPALGKKETSAAMREVNAVSSDVGSISEEDAVAECRSAKISSRQAYLCSAFDTTASHNTLQYQDLSLALQEGLTRTSDSLSSDAT